MAEHKECDVYDGHSDWIIKAIKELKEEYELGGKELKEQLNEESQQRLTNKECWMKVQKQYHELREKYSTFRGNVVDALQCDGDGNTHLVGNVYGDLDDDDIIEIITDMKEEYDPAMMDELKEKYETLEYQYDMEKQCHLEDLDEKRAEIEKITNENLAFKKTMDKVGCWDEHKGYDADDEE